MFVREGARPLYLSSHPGTTVRPPPTHTHTQSHSSILQRLSNHLRKYMIEIVNVQIIILKMPFEFHFNEFRFGGGLRNHVHYPKSLEYQSFLIRQGTKILASPRSCSYSGLTSSSLIMKGIKVATKFLHIYKTLRRVITRKF